MCAGRDLIDKTISEATQVLQSTSNVKIMQRDWKRRCQGEQTKASLRCLLKFWKNEPEVKEDKPTIQEFEEPLPKVSEVISHDKNDETNMNVGRSMGNARPLVEFNPSDWIQVDFAP
jgi:hypothetical protein